MATDAHKQWVLDVLHIDIDDPALRSGKLLPIWTSAKERVDQGFDKLQGVLRSFDDPDFKQLAEYGLNGITQRESVRLVAALMDADSGGGTAKLTAAIDRFRGFLDGSPIVELLERNEFGVPLPIRTQFGTALSLIEARIAA